MSIAGSTTDDNNTVDVFENNKKLMHSNISNGFAKQQTTASMPSLQKSSPQSSGLFSFSQKPDFAGWFLVFIVIEVFCYNEVSMTVCNY